jgi:oligosaccharide repeat unit polymerase
VLSGSLILWAALMRTLTGTWLQPGSFFAIFWCFAGIVPMILAPKDPVAPIAIVWLLAASVCMSLGAALGNRGFRSRHLVAPPGTTERELFILSSLLSIAIVLGMGSNVAFLKSSSLAFADLFDIQKLVVSSNQAYFQRYAEAGAPPPPVMSQALLPFVYLAPALGGIVFEMRREKLWKLVGLASFLPAVTVTILQTTKAAVLFAMILWLSSYFATRVRNGKLAVFTRTHVLVSVGAGGILTGFLFAVSLARLASTDLSLLNIVVGKLVSAAFGHMTVFSGWLSEYVKEPFNPSLGSVTFAGPLEMLGFSKRIPGLFESIVDLVTGETSNIYTGFRPLIQDFTIPGALLILTAVGFVGGVGFRRVAMGRWSAMPLLLIAYVTIFWSPITWFWIYNSLTATILAVALIVVFVRILRRVGGRNIQGDELAGTA